MKEIDEKQFYWLIGRALREQRLAKSLKQAAFAERLGMLRSSLANIESGRQRLPVHVLYRICAELEIELSEVLPEQDEVLGESPILKMERSATPAKTQASLDQAKQLLNGTSAEEL